MTNEQTRIPIDEFASDVRGFLGRVSRDGREFVVGNVHLDSGDNRAQVERAGFLLERFARGAPMILLGRISEVTVEPGRSLMMRSGRSRPVSVMIWPCLRCVPRMPVSSPSDSRSG